MYPCQGGTRVAQNPFIGTWRLVSCELRRADGQVSYPVGRDPVGYIIYNPDGYMSVAFMSADRPKFAAGDMMERVLGAQSESIISMYREIMPDVLSMMDESKRYAGGMQ